MCRAWGLLHSAAQDDLSTAGTLCVARHEVDITNQLMLLDKFSETRWGTGKDKLPESWMQRTTQQIKRNRCRTAGLCLLSVAAAGIVLLSSGGANWLTDAPIKQPGRVLVVTAHPDDEVIFFATTITALHASGSEVFLLCLTDGAHHLFSNHECITCPQSAKLTPCPSLATSTERVLKIHISIWPSTAKQTFIASYL